MARLGSRRRWLDRALFQARSRGNSPTPTNEQPALVELPSGAREFFFDVLAVSKIYRVSLLKADQHALGVFGDMSIGCELCDGCPLVRDHSDAGRDALIGLCEELQEQGVVHHRGMTFVVAGQRLLLGHQAHGKLA